MLRGINTGFLTPPHGIAGRSLLGRQVRRALGAPPGGADSIKTRLTPNAIDGDVYILSTNVSPGNYTLVLAQDGTYSYNAFSDGSRQTMRVDKYDVTLGALNGEGALTINDAPPQPAGGPGTTFYNGVVFSLGQVVSKQLVAVDPNGDVVTFTISSGALPPGLAMDAAGLVTGTTTTFGLYAVTTRITDPYGAFTDVHDTVTVSSAMPNFVGQLIATVTASATALGLTISSSTFPSAQPVGTVLSQLPLPGSAILTGGVLVLVLSDGSLSVGNPNVFPQNIRGLTFKGTREHIWKTVVQTSITGKTTSFAYSQYPIVQWDLNYELLDQAAALDDLKKIEGLFNQSQGQASTFLYEDPEFNSVAAQLIGTGDGETKAFQLIAADVNITGPGGTEVVQAVQPSPAIQVFDNGTLVASNAYAVGPTGVVTFNAAPAVGHLITWTGKFYYNCRFQTDDLNPTQFMQTFWSLQSLKFQSVVL